MGNFEGLEYRSCSKKGKGIARSLRNKIGLGCKTVKVEEDFTTLLSSGFRSKGDGVLRSSMFKDMSKLRSGFVESVQESYKFAPSLDFLLLLWIIQFVSALSKVVFQNLLKGSLKLAITLLACQIIPNTVE